jgi:hypothetical protein
MTKVKLQFATLLLAIASTSLVLGATSISVPIAHACTPDFVVTNPSGSFRVLRGGQIGLGIGVSSVCGFVGGISWSVSVTSPTPTITCDKKDVCTSNGPLIHQATYHFYLTATQTSGGGVFTVTAPTTASLTTYTLTASAYNGIIHRSKTFTVTIDDFTVAATPTNPTFQAGQSANVTITTTAVNGYVGTIYFSANCPSGSTTGVSCPYGPGSATLTSTTSSVQSQLVFSGTTPGTYTVTFSGSPTVGSNNRTVTITVTIR